MARWLLGPHDTLPCVLICMYVCNRGESRISEGGVLTWTFILCAMKVDTTSVLWSMLYLGGSGGMPPQENLANLAY